MPGSTTSTTSTVIDTPIGPVSLVAGPKGLTHLRLGATPDGSGEHPHRTARGVLEAATRQLTEYFAGRRRAFDVPLDLVGTPFQVAVWRALLKIPFGTTASYGDIARMIGKPKAVRAVGAANGANNIAIIVPCHRIVGSDGTLTGYGGGLPMKRRLLAHEGIALSRDRVVS